MRVIIDGSPEEFSALVDSMRMAISGLGTRIDELHTDNEVSDDIQALNQRIKILNDRGLNVQQEQIPNPIFEIFKAKNAGTYPNCFE